MGVNDLPHQELLPVEAFHTQGAELPRKSFLRYQYIYMCLLCSAVFNRVMIYDPIAFPQFCPERVEAKPRGSLNPKGFPPRIITTLPALPGCTASPTEWRCMVLFSLVLVVSCAGPCSQQKLGHSLQSMQKRLGAVFANLNSEKEPQCGRVFSKALSLVTAFSCLLRPVNFRNPAISIGSRSLSIYP